MDRNQKAGRGQAVEANEAANEQTLGAGIEHCATLTIMASPEKLYEFWRDVDNLPQFMQHLKNVEKKSDIESEWTWEVLHGLTDVTWTSEVRDENPGAMLAWETTGSKLVKQTGLVTFTALPYERGTVVEIISTYYPIGGKVTDFVETLLGESPSRIMREDLRRLRFLMESGRIPTVKGQSSGREKVSKS